MRSFGFDDDQKQRSFAADYQRYAGKLLPLPLVLKGVMPSQAAGNKSPRAGHAGDLSSIQAKLQLPALSTKLLNAVPHRTLLVYSNVRPAGMKSRSRENVASRGSPTGDLERARSQGLKERPHQLPSVAAPASKAVKAATWPVVPAEPASGSHKLPEASRVPPARSTAVSREGGSVLSEAGGNATADRAHREPSRASSQRGGNGSMYGSAGRVGQSPQRHTKSGSHKSSSNRSPEKQRKVRPRSGRRVRPARQPEPATSATVSQAASPFFLVSGEQAPMSAQGATPASIHGKRSSSEGLPPVPGRNAAHAEGPKAERAAVADASHGGRGHGAKEKDTAQALPAVTAVPIAAPAPVSTPEATPAPAAAHTGDESSEPPPLPAIPEQEAVQAAAAAANGGAPASADSTAIASANGAGTAAERAGDATASSSESSDKKLLNKRYRIEKVIGEGAYGVVLKCTDVRSGGTVALKQFKISGPDADDVRRTSAREVAILRQFQHPNIVAFVDEFQEAAEKVYVVMEFVPKNLLELLEEAAGGLDKSVVRSTIRQLCRAIGYLHKHAVLYRDVKPENILIDSTGNLKLCDFGFARRWTAGSAEILTDYVATRWYRAPELLLGPPFVNAQGAKVRSPYGPPADLWAVGAQPRSLLSASTLGPRCIIGELVDGEPMFAGDSDLDQLHRIMGLRGSLTQQQLQLFNANPHHIEVRIPLDGEHMRSDGSNFQQRYMGKMSEVELEFTMRLLEMDPERRPSAEEALQLEWMKEDGAMEE